MTDRPKISAEDRDLFNAEVSDVSRIHDERVPQQRRRPPARAKFTRADEQSVLDESLQAELTDIEHSNGDSLRFRRAHVSDRVLRKLARGGYAIDDEIDLHGLNSSQACDALREFIADARAQRKLCVRVIHGKGRGSGHGGPVLKYKVNAWLQRWDPVLAFVSARQIDGGTGAVYVLLKD